MIDYTQQLANPIKIEDGQKISEPGIYDLPIELYHSQICDAFSVSSSGLRLLEEKSPLHFSAEYIDPDREEKEQKTHFNLGQAVHLLFLGDGSFFDSFAVRPAQYDSWRTNDAKEWKAEMEATGKYVLIPSDLEKIEGMARMLGKEPMIKQHGLLSGFIERSLIWKDKETGIWLKARPDVIPPIENTIVDLKTIGTSASDDDCQKAIGAHGYHIQLALVNMGMEALFGRTMKELTLLFVETKKPYAYNIKPVDQRAIFLGECQIRRALRTLAECMDRDHWPTFQGNGLYAYLPGWTQKTLEQDLEGGLLPDVQNTNPVMEAAE